MATARRVRMAGGLSVLGRSVQEAIVWALVAHLVYNRWGEILGPAGEWDYGYSLYGVVSFLVDRVVPSQWVPLLVGGIALVGLVMLGFKFLPLITAAWNRPVHTLLTAMIVFGLTIGLFEAIYYGWTSGEVFFTPNLIYQAVPPLVVATIVIAGRGGRVYFSETGARDVIGMDDEHGDAR